MSFLFVEVENLESVPLADWERFLNASGWPTSLQGGRLSYDTLLSEVHANPASPLGEAVSTVMEMGTDRASTALLDAMADDNLDLPLELRDLSPAQLALEVFRLHQGSARWSDIFTRARMEVQQGGRTLRYYEFPGKEARKATNLAARLDKLVSQMRSYCVSKGLGDHVEHRRLEEGCTIIVHVLRSDRTQTPRAIVNQEPQRLRFRPIKCDVLRYDASIGMLKVAANRATLAEHYRGLMGAALFEDDGFFLARPQYTLSGLANSGAELLDNHNLSGIYDPRVTELQWQRGDRHKLLLRSTDCLQEARRLGLHLEQGQILSVKLKLRMAGQSTRPVTVDLQPSRCHSGIQPG